MISRFLEEYRRFRGGSHLLGAYAHLRKQAAIAGELFDADEVKNLGEAKDVLFEVLEIVAAGGPREGEK